MVLDGKKIPYQVVDISSDDSAKAKMRELAGASSLPPQIANGDQYCGVRSVYKLFLIKRKNLYFHSSCELFCARVENAVKCKQVLMMYSY